MSIRPPIIVVPEGLAANSQGAAMPVPSFVFREVLDKVATDATLADTIYLAPGNRLEFGVIEHEVAGGFLRARSSSHVVVPNISCCGYIDTRGNARLLREFLERQRLWPLAPVRLYVARPHAKRSALCFRKEGFSLCKVEAVRYKIQNELVVRRWWYYRSNFWHLIYEAVAIVIDLLRPSNRSVK